jgi:hypothetical protein|tara:strand:+ start:861 stop:1568 length:708 start_codon:yes stop_codon:yes gene_type:complete
MEEFLLQAPIPGQSLTDEPKNFPWENPAELNTIDEALKYHIDRLTKNPEALEDLYTLIDIGYPLRSLAESMTSVAVMEGIHSIDISLSLNTTLYQELVELAEEANLDYITGLEEDDVAKKEKQEQKLESQLRRELKKMEDEEGAEGYDDSLLEEALDFLSDDTPIDEKETLPITPYSPPKLFGDEGSPDTYEEYREETAPPEEGGPFNPYPLGSDENPLMAEGKPSKGLMSRGEV